MDSDELTSYQMDYDPEIDTDMDIGCATVCISDSE